MSEKDDDKEPMYSKEYLDEVLLDPPPKPVTLEQVVHRLDDLQETTERESKALRDLLANHLSALRAEVKTAADWTIGTIGTGLVVLIVLTLSRRC